MKNGTFSALLPELARTLTRWKKTATKAFAIALSSVLLAPGLFLGAAGSAEAKTVKAAQRQGGTVPPPEPPATAQTGVGGVYQPETVTGKAFAPINVSAAED